MALPRLDGDHVLNPLVCCAIAFRGGFVFVRVVAAVVLLRSFFLSGPLDLRSVVYAVVLYVFLGLSGLGITTSSGRERLGRGQTLVFFFLSGGTRFAPEQPIYNSSVPDL